MKQILPASFQENVFEMIGKDWMLITAQKGDKINTMTSSWGWSWCNLEQKCGNRLYQKFALYKRICG